MTSTVWYIHGANASPASFSYMKAQFPDHEVVDVAYDCAHPALGVLDHLTKEARASKTPFAVVGHSLGGVLGVSLAQRSSKVSRVVTLASPFGGSRAASLLRWLIPSQLLSDIAPSSKLITTLHALPVNVPVLSLVTTYGHSALMAEPNDGVVTVASQQALTGPTYVPVPKNHFEVLLCPDVANTARSFLFR